MNNFGEFLYQLRKEKAMTQTELADRLGVTNKAVSKWETGEAYPETAQLLPLSKIFDVSIDELLNGRRVETANQTQSVSIDYRQKEERLPLSSKEIALLAIGLTLILLGAFSVAVLAALNMKSQWYLSALFVCVSVGVYLLIVMGMERTMRICELDVSKCQIGRRYVNLIAVGVGLLILSPLTIILLDAYIANEALTFAVFFIILLAGIISIVLGGVLWSNFSKTTTSLSQIEESGNAKSVAGAIIMPLCVIIFLCLGFFGGLWHPGWIVFPIGAIATGIIETILHRHD